MIHSLCVGNRQLSVILDQSCVKASYFHTRSPPFGFVPPCTWGVKSFFVGQQIISVVIMYTFHNNYVCHALINGTDLESQCYKYQLELLSKDNVNSVLLRWLSQSLLVRERKRFSHFCRRDRLQPLTVMDNHSHFESRKMSLQVDIAYVSEMLKNPTKIFARMGIVKKSKKQLHQITGRALHDPPSPSAASTCSTEEAAFDEDLLSELECPVCNEYMIAPIFICVTGTVNDNPKIIRGSRWHSICRAQRVQRLQTEAWVMSHVQVRLWKRT